MKKIFFVTTIIILFCNALYCQWAPIGAKWTYSLTFVMSNDIDTFVVRSVGDTSIQGHLCKILKKSAGLCDLRPIIEYMYEDSGKVFFYDNSRNIFQILYDFNGNIGDSTVIYPDYYPSNDYISTIIDSISSININSHVLKKLYVHCSSSSTNWIPSNSGVVIENIGDTYYMFPWLFGGCDAQWAEPLRCYEDTVVGAYNFNTAPSCDYTLLVGINEVDNLSNINVSPNPVTQNTQINLPQNISLINLTIEIFDIQGRKVKKYCNLKEHQLTLTRSEFNVGGLYFVQIKNNDFSETIKLVVN